MENAIFQRQLWAVRHGHASMRVALSSTSNISKFYYIYIYIYMSTLRYTSFQVGKSEDPKDLLWSELATGARDRVSTVVLSESCPLIYPQLLDTLAFLRRFESFHILYPRKTTVVHVVRTVSPRPYVF